MAYVSKIKSFKISNEIQLKSYNNYIMLLKINITKKSKN